MRSFIPVVLLVLAGDVARAQSVADSSRFRPLELPAPNVYRTASGRPGPQYWQQRVDYRITAELDTARQELRGSETVTYRNESPDALPYLWMFLEQNICAPGSITGTLNQPPLIFQDAVFDFSCRGFQGGVVLEHVRSGGRDVAYEMYGTTLKVLLPQPLASRSTLELELAWRFPIPPYGAARMGRDGSLYEIAWWYPRMAVYDDVRGWNHDPYIGAGEFYLEYGSFDVSLTVPASMLVAATGTLRNPAEVLTPAQRERLARARGSAQTVVIRGVDEVRDPASRPPTEFGTFTWRFTADSVRDFAWAASSTFVWDAVGVNGGRTLAMSYYPPSAQPLWKDATEYAKTAIENYSAQWAPYPYPYASNVRGIESGMEYPMIVFCNRPDPEALYSVTDHEFGHTWFPMVVGSNERRYGWMDEGLNEFINYYNWIKRFGRPPAHRGSLPSYLEMATSGRERPVMSFPDQLPGEFVGPAAYDKPAIALRLLRDVVVGPERFDPAFREYFRRWAYKHPTPADFFRTIEDGVGEDLSWFWRGWLFTTAQLDQAVDSLALSDSAGVVSRIYLRNEGGIPMPVQLSMLMDDGSTRQLQLPVEIWFGGTRYTAVIPGPHKVNSVIIDADGVYPDVDRADNRWPRAPATP